MRCTACDRHRHIAGHPHRQHIRADTRRVQVGKQFLHGLELNAQCFIIAVGFGDTHQPAYDHIRQLRHFHRQRDRLFGRNAVFRLLARDIDFDAHLQRRHFGRTLFAQAVGGFQTTYRMHPMRAFGDKFGFVRLHIADDVPNDVGQIRERFRFLVPLLNIVFTKITLSCGIYLADVI